MLKISVFLTCLTLAFTQRDTRPVIKTNYGKIRGDILKSENGRDFYSFKGIPYAKPPVGNLRFKAPVSPSKYDGILDGTVDGDDCFQVNVGYNQYIGDSKEIPSQYIGSEDCLYLNVHSPRLEGSKLSVMVFIHAGSFKFGTGASTIQGPQFFMDKDVVIVTINYRLEILGFLRADDTYIPGNLGLKDQSAALRWVKENIEHFNGDSEAITIFGESAGAAGVHFQLLAPRNKGIFRSAISQGGFINCPWAIRSLQEAKKLAETLATSLNCPTEPQLMLQCLQDKSVIEMYQSFSTFKTKLSHHMDIKPVIENDVPGAFITESALKKGSNIPWIIGIANGEGNLFLGEWLSDYDPDLSVLNKTYREVFPGMFYMTSWPQPAEVASKIKEYYLGNKDINMNNVKEVSNIFSDGIINYGFHKAGQKHLGKLYRYVFSHFGERTFTNEKLRRPDLGASHGDEMHLLFYSKFYFKDSKLNDKDSKVSKHLLDLWVNFATYGNPTPEGSEIKWPESSKNSKYLEITTDGLKVGSDVFKERLQFWEEIFNSYEGNKSD